MYHNEKKRSGRVAFSEPVSYRKNQTLLYCHEKGERLLTQFEQEMELTEQNDCMKTKRMIRTVPPAVRESLLYVQEMGWMQCKETHRCTRTDALESFLLLVIQKGQGKMEVAGESMTLHQSDVVFLDCRQPYTFCSDSRDPWQFIWVHWNGTVLPTLYEMFRQRTPSGVLHNAADPLKPLLSRLHNLVQNVTPDYEIYASECLAQLSTYLLTANAAAPAEGKHDSLQKWEQVHRYIDTHFSEKLTLESLSEQFGISKSYLLREFKKTYGVTIVQYINQCRMNHAKHLLRFTELQVEEIAQNCGIPDSSYFNRIFRTTEGISAGAYRKQWGDGIQ